MREKMYKSGTMTWSTYWRDKDKLQRDVKRTGVTFK